MSSTLRGELGVRPRDRIALWADNGPHWPTIDFASLVLGGVVVPLDPALPADDAVARVQTSAARVVFIQGAERLAAFLARRDELPAVDHVVAIGQAPRGEGLGDLRELIDRGADGDPAEIEAAARERRADDPATLVHTAGTAGEPREILLTHGQIATAVSAAGRVLPVGEHHTALVWHSLASVFERTLHYLYLHRGAAVVYPPSQATFLRDLRVQPHVTSATFADCKRLMNAIYDGVQRQPPWRQRLFRWAVATGRQALPYRLAGQKPPGVLGFKSSLADRLVFEKLRRLTGGRLELVVTTGTSLSAGWLSFLWAAGLPIYESYGLAEAAGIVTINAPGAVRLETAGRPLPGVDVRIAEDGEILLRGAAVAPGSAAGNGDADGWLATGDDGRLDAEGFLTVTGRRADRVRVGGEESFSPSSVERLLASSHFFHHAVVFARDGGPVALLFPDFERLRAASGLGDVSPRALVGEPRVRELVATEIEGIVGTLPEPRRPRSWELLPDALRLERGELTVAGTVRRRAVIEKYGAPAG